MAAECFFNNPALIISIFGIIIAVIALIPSFRTNIIAKKYRTNEMRPSFEYFNSDAKAIKMDIYKVEAYFELLNTGGKALIVKIEENSGNKINCNQINKSIETKGILAFTIIYDNIINPEEFTYNLKLVVSDIDKREYYQRIYGKGIRPIISSIIKG